MSSKNINHEKNSEIYYSNPSRLTSSKCKSSRDIRKNVKFTPFCPIEINNKLHNIDSDNDNSTVISIQTKFILKKDKKKKQSSGKLKKVSFSCRKEKEEKDEINKEKSKEKKKPKFVTHKSHSININYDELIEGLKKNIPQIKLTAQKTEENLNHNNFKSLKLKPAKSLNPRHQKLINLQENFEIKKKSKNEDHLIQSTLTNNLLGSKDDTIERRKSFDFGLILSHAEEKVKHFTNTETISDFYEYTEKCMSMILDLDPSKKNQINEKVNFNFPKNENYKKIALFDLDETLVHCTGEINENNHKKYQNVVEVILPSKKKVEIGLNIRPFWKEALDLIKEKYHIVIFTASHQSYANAVLDFMDPKKKYTQYRLYRNDCVLTNIDGVKFYIKDLSIFDKYYNLKNIVLIDNSVLSFAYHLENGIPIVPYYDADEDGELEILACYLLSIYEYNDLREANKNHIRIEFFLDKARKERETMNEESSSISSSVEDDDDDDGNDNDNDHDNENNNNIIRSYNENNHEIKNDNNESNVMNLRKKTHENISIVNKEVFDKSNEEKTDDQKKSLSKYCSLKDFKSSLRKNRRCSSRKKTTIGLDVKKMWGDLKKEFNLILKNN